MRVTGALEVMSLETVIGPSATIVVSPVSFNWPGGEFPKFTAQSIPVTGQSTWWTPEIELIWVCQ